MRANEDTGLQRRVSEPKRFTRFSARVSPLGLSPEQD